MKIRGKKLKARASASGQSVESLAQAVSRVGLKGENAVSAIRNWMADRDHPRCKAQDIAKLAQSLGCQPKDIASFSSMVRYHRGSPRKAKLLVDLIRGKSVTDAQNLLGFHTKRAAVNVLKCLDAAVAEAEQAQADPTALIVSECRVSEGPRIKRFQPKDRGRAHPIIKPLSHITVAVEERN